MSLIEVDHKLFITCRLCVHDTGVYQIVPDIITKIKYCFDIEVELLYGLPQLICRKCLDILNEYNKVKQHFQHEQNKLLSTYKGHGGAEIINHQQDTVSSTQQTCTESQSKVDVNQKVQGEKVVSRSRNSSLDTSYTVTSNTELESSIKLNTSLKQWQKNYTKQFICRFCAKALCHKKSIIYHTQRCPLLKKYSNLLKRCSVNIKNINTKPNLTGSSENVVVNKTRIIDTKNSSDYYVVYSLKSPIKSESSESSDDDFIAKRKFHKRRRLSSECSNETVVIENNNESRIKNVVSTDVEGDEKTDNNCNDMNIPHESDVEFVDLDDSDIESCPSGIATLNTSDNTTNTIKDTKSDGRKTVVNDIVSMCRAKYLKRFDGRNNSKDNKCNSFLQRKLLSIGRKVINKEGFNATGLLRYMEQNDLDVVWVPKQDANVAINTTLKENKNKSAIEEDGGIWKSLNLLDNTTDAKDFIDRFEKVTAISRPQAKQTYNTSSKEVKSINIKEVKNTTNKEVKNTTSKEVINTTSKEVINITNKQAKNTTNKEVINTTKKPAKNTINKEVLITTTKQATRITNNEVNNTNNTINVPTNEQEPNLQNLENYNERIEGNVLYINTRADTKVTNNNMLKKLLNTNPVANPKQLPRKTEIVAVVEKSAHTDNFPETKNAHSLQDSTDSSNVMPIITSTMSLAPSHTSNTEVQLPDTGSGDADAVEETPQPSTSKLPRIKVKDVSELMPNLVPIRPRGVAIPSNVWSGANDEKVNEMGSVAVHTVAQVIPTGTPMFYVVPRPALYHNPLPQYNPAPQYVAIQPAEPAPQPPTRSVPKNYLIMDTVQLPNQKTDKPFQYFKELLLLHNIILFYGPTNDDLNKLSLVKFRLLFQQDGNPEVTLFLKLSCFQNIYCIHVTDNRMEDMSEDKLTANWQWEILKGFKGEVVNKLLENARKVSPEIFKRTNQFVSLLKTIEVKECS